MKDWASALQRALSKTADKIPPGFLTCKEWQQKFGLRESQTLRRLKLMVDAGEMERRELMAFNGHLVCRKSHWKLTK